MNVRILTILGVVVGIASVTIGAMEVWNISGWRFARLQQKPRMGNPSSAQSVETPVAGVIQPVLTPAGITFAVPQNAHQWIGLNAVCFSGLQDFTRSHGYDGATAMGLFSSLNRGFPEALRRLDLEPGKDVKAVDAILGYEEESEAQAFVFALHLRYPERLPTFFADLFSALEEKRVEVQTAGPGHYVLTQPLGSKQRQAQIWVFRVGGWPSGADDPQSRCTVHNEGDWNCQARKANYVLIMVTAPSGKPLRPPRLAEPQAAHQILKELEGLVDDPRDRCLQALFRHGGQVLPKHRFSSLRLFAVAPPRSQQDKAAEFVDFPRSPLLRTQLFLEQPLRDSEIQEALGGALKDARPFFEMLAGFFQEAPPGDVDKAEFVKLIEFVLTSALDYRLHGRELELSFGTENISRKLGTEDAFLIHSLTFFRLVKDRAREAQALLRLGELSLVAEKLSQAQHQFQEARAVFHDLRDSKLEALAAIQLCEVAHRQGLAKEAQRHCREALELCRQAHSASCQARALNSSGVLAFELLHDPSAALRLLDQALEQARLPDVLANRLETLVAAGRFSEVLEQAEAVIAAQGEPRVQIVLAALGWMAVQLSQGSETTRWGRKMHEAYAKLEPGQRIGWSFSGLRHALQQGPWPSHAVRGALALILVLEQPVSDASRRALEGLVGDKAE